MTALIHELKVGLMAGSNADQHIGLMVFAEVRTKPALSVLNGFHVDPPVASAEGDGDRLSKLTVVLFLHPCKSRQNRSNRTL